MTAPQPTTVDLTAAASWVVAVQTEPGMPEAARTNALILWRRLVGADSDQDGLAMARAVVARDSSTPLYAYVPTL